MDIQPGDSHEDEDGNDKDDDDGDGDDDDDDGDRREVNLVSKDTSSHNSFCLRLLVIQIGISIIFNSIIFNSMPTFFIRNFLYPAHHEQDCHLKEPLDTT